MSSMTWFLLIVTGAMLLAYRGATLAAWAAAAAAALAVAQLTTGGLSIFPWLVLGAVTAPLLVRPLRRHLLSRPLLQWFRKVTPAMSDTEKAAIDAGTVWWDADLFSGAPDWNRLLDTPAPRLTDEERAYLDGPVEELCRQLNDWDINNETRDLPPEAWELIRRHRFFGMIIPKKYGGLEFSARAQSEVVMKIASRSGAAGVTVMVPNSLGPGELLMHYGTEAQKEHFLPRLARGEEIPAFALTGPYAGSDAGSMPDVGVVCRGEHNGKETLGFRVNWSKRYITLGPVATILGLAFKAEDPDGLLGDRKQLGITCALIPTDTPGVEIGDRHDPGSAFMNGPNAGRDVFVPMDWIIGGQAQVGNGWKMLMDCLSVGRAISLPAMGASSGKLAARSTGAYARIRKQFRTPIGKFEGIEEALARIGGIAYRMNAARVITAGALDAGQKPSVLSAILKHHNTEGMRQTLNDAMDVHAGRGVCRGPMNYLAQGYQTIPVAITVEGANILTRSMIIFGQGAIRCHPYVLAEMQAAADTDAARSLEDFDRALFGHIGFTVRNAARSLVLGMTDGRLASVPEIGRTTRYLRQLTRYSAAFALLADVAMLSLGGELKRREKLSGRFADILSHLYLASAVIKHHCDQGRPAADLPLVEWALQDSLAVIEESMDGILRNFPSRVTAAVLRRLVMPFGRRRQRPSDRLGHQVSSLLLSPSESRNRLTEGLFFDLTTEDPLGLMELTLQKMIAAEPAERKLVKALKATPAPDNYLELIAKAQAAGAINDLEGQAIREAMELTMHAVQVDSFPAAGRETAEEHQVA